MKSADRSGFTLVEVLLASVLAIVALTAVGLLITDSGVFASRNNRSNVYALNAVREQIEDIRNTNFDTLIGYGSPYSFTNAQLAMIPGAIGSVVLADAAGSDIKKITVSVTWVGAKGESLSTSATTQISRSGINSGSGVARSPSGGDDDDDDDDDDDGDDDDD